MLGVEVLGVCGEHFRDVSGVLLRVFEAISKGVLKQFQGSFRRVSRMFPVFHGSLKTISRLLWKFQRCFKEVMRCFLESFMGALGKWVFKECFTGDSRKFQKTF